MESRWPLEIGFRTGFGVGVGCGVGLGFGSPINLNGVPALGGIAASLSQGFHSMNGALGGPATQLRSRVRASGMQGLDLGIGCGVGVGYGFGFGAFLTQDAAAALARRAQDAKRRLSSAAARFMPTQQQAQLQAGLPQPAGAKDIAPVAAAAQSGHAVARLPKAARPQALDLNDLRWRPRQTTDDVPSTSEGHAGEASTSERHAAELTKREGHRRGGTRVRQGAGVMMHGEEVRSNGISGNDIVELTHALREHSAAVADSTRALQDAVQALRVLRPP